MRVKNDNHISGNAWPEQVVGLVKMVAVLGFSVAMEPVLPVALLSLSYTQRTQRPGNMTTH